MFITLIVVMASWVYAYAQIHKLVYIKYGKFLVYKLYFNKAIKIRKCQNSVSLYLLIYSMFINILSCLEKNVTMFSCILLNILVFQMDYGLNRHGIVTIIYNVVFKLQNMF